MVKRNQQLGSHFATRTARDEKKAGKFDIGTSFKSLRNIRDYGQSRPANLIHECQIFRAGANLGEAIDFMDHASRLLKDVKLLKCFRRSGCDDLLHVDFIHAGLFGFMTQRLRDSAT